MRSQQIRINFFLANTRQHIWNETVRVMFPTFHLASEPQFLMGSPHSVLSNITETNIPVILNSTILAAGLKNFSRNNEIDAQANTD